MRGHKGLLPINISVIFLIIHLVKTKIQLETEKSEVSSSTHMDVQVREAANSHFSLVIIQTQGLGFEDSC